MITKKTIPKNLRRNVKVIDIKNSDLSKEEKISKTIQSMKDGK